VIGGIQLKVCGLRSVGDAEAAAGLGAGYLGFIFHAKSPRGISISDFRSMADRLPAAHKVAVCVEPSDVALAALAGSGCGYFQVHVSHDFPLPLVTAWSRQVGPERLWLAPRLPPGTGISPAWLPLARTFLLDTYESDRFGGTGKTGDWAQFGRVQSAHPDKTWILSGGLNPDNIAEAVRQSGACFVDVNSGVESSPGVKDPARLAAFVSALRQHPRGQAGGA